MPLRIPALLAIALAAAGGCASTPKPAPGTALVTGEIHLVPRTATSSDDPAAYLDRRMRDVVLVDYSKPGFSVVYLQQGPSPGGVAELVIEPSPTGMRLRPRYAVVGTGGEIVIESRANEPQLVSVPAAGRLERLAPGASLRVPVPAAGEVSLFLLGVPGEESRVVAVPGPWQVVQSTGRFTLRDVAPGRVELRVWHPRFPPRSLELELRPDEVRDLVIELGAGIGGEEGPRAAP